jgi:tetratricopeptide (TPR) repeat protein
MAQNDEKNHSETLKSAWQHFADLDLNASISQAQHLLLRRWVIILSMIATLLALLLHFYQMKSGAEKESLVKNGLQIGLILVPIVSSTVLAFSNKVQQGERWLVLRSGAAEIEMETYQYRTCLQGNKKRNQWLNNRVKDIQRRIHEPFGGDLVLKPYVGNLPPYYDPDQESGDQGFNDLSAEEYFYYRLEDQLNWHSKKIAQFQSARIRLQVIIFTFGGLGTFLAALGGNFSMWVALTASIATGINGWIELHGYDKKINNYSHLILDLKIIRDHWLSLSPEQRTNKAFFDFVNNTENVLWNQHQGYISEMYKSVRPVEEQEDLEEEADETPPQATEATSPAVTGENAPSEKKPQSTPSPESIPEAKLGEDDGRKSVDEKTDTKTKIPIPQPMPGKPYAFVVSPVGQKKAEATYWIDFDAVYNRLIQPALEKAGFQSFRANEEALSDMILPERLQPLLQADLVIVDLSMDDASISYKLGVRHALRKQGLIYLHLSQLDIPSGILADQAIPYHCESRGQLDSEYLMEDMNALTKAASEFLHLDQQRTQSPIFQYLSRLVEPDRWSLAWIPSANHWAEYDEWKRRLSISERRRYVGDILVRVEEIENPSIKEKVIEEAGKALRNLEYHTLALNQYENGLKLNPKNSEFRRWECYHLGHLKRYDEAIVKLEQLREDEPTNIYALTHLARIHIYLWEEEWQNISDSQERLTAAYEHSHRLRQGIDFFLQSFRLDSSDPYPGVMALTFSMVLDYLMQHNDMYTDTEIELLRQQLPMLKGAVEFSLENAIQRKDNEFAVFSLGYLTVFTAETPVMVTRTFRRAISLSKKDKFILRFTMSDLEYLELLGIRLEYVQPSITLLKEELYKLEQEVGEHLQSPDSPQHVFLFAGHMVDRPKRTEPRFPPGMEKEVLEKIREAMDMFNANSQDLAITGGAACGGDLLFIEECLQRNMKVKVFLPFNTDDFVETSVSFAGDSWVERFYRVTNHPNVTIHIQPDRLGPVKVGDDAYARNNRWTFYSTLVYPSNLVRFIVLWEGKGGDGAGGTAHLVQEVLKRGGDVKHLNTTQFNYWNKKASEPPEIATK